MLKSLLHRIRSRFRKGDEIPKGWVDVERGGYRWRLCMDHYLDQEIYATGKFEPQTTQWFRTLVQPGMTVLDVGANIGYYAVLAADRVGTEGHVWAFEPLPEYYDRAESHVEANGFAERVTLLPYGLSSENQTIQISIGNSSATAAPVAGDDFRDTANVEMRRLDEVANSLALKKIDLIKIDVDGYEGHILEGASSVLRRDHPTILIEFSRRNLEAIGTSVAQLREQLEALDYALYSDHSGQRYDDESLFNEECASLTLSANVWALPREQALECLPTPNE